MLETVRFRIWARAFAVGSFVHLLLPDFEQDGWWAPGLVEGLGAAWLLWRPAAPAFALCLVGTLWPLLFLRDVLTQSALLSLWAALGLIGALWPKQRTPALDGVRMVAAATYWIAALHKLNTAFFDPALGCAEHAWGQVAARYGLPEALPAAPFVAIGLEVTIGILIWRRSRWVWPLGLAFHLPLTVTLAPAFGAVMISSYFAGLDARTLARWRQTLRGGWPGILGLGAVAAVTEYLWAGVGELGPALKTGVAVALLITTMASRLCALAPLREISWLSSAALTLWVANGLTPYFGLQYQHAAAMLSGLRIDPGCHNSLVVPEWLRLDDPYVRIDRAEVPGNPKRARVVEETLWNLSALHTMHKNWCPAEGAITFSGTWQGKPFHIEDLCANNWRDALPGTDLLPGFQRFQKNLKRACRQACIH